MRFFFHNPYYGHRQWNGRRVHVMQFIRHLVECGHDVYTYAGADRDGMKAVSANPFLRYTQLIAMDVFYVRVEGTPIRLPWFLRAPFRYAFAHVPLVWEIEDTPELQASPFPPEVGAGRVREFQRLARPVSLAICPTESLAHYARDLGIPRQAVIPNGSDPEMFQPGRTGACEVPTNPEGLNIIWIGNPEWPTWHDFDTMRLAAHALIDDPRFRFFIVTPGPPIVDLPPNMSHVAQRPYPELPELLGRMDVGLCLYRNENWTRYGAPTSPLKLFDYMACGLIAVGSPIDQVYECLDRRGAGFVVPFEDVTALTGTLRSILDRKAQLDDMRRIARSLVVDHYNWRRAALQTVDAIRALRTA